MSKSRTLLEDLCERALSCGARALDVEYQDSREWVYAFKGDFGFSIASFPGSSREAKELRASLNAGRKKPIQVAIDGQVWILKVKIYDSFGENAFLVSMAPAPKRDRPVARSRGRKKTGTERTG